MDQLTDKTLIMIVGPSAIGKSTIMNQVVQLDSTFGRVKSFTTRPPRANDEPNQYFYLQTDQLASLTAQNKVVSQVTFPTTGQTYGTLDTSFGSQYNLLDTLANSVDTYRNLPFKKTLVISLTAPAESWRQWFITRYPIPSQEARQRLDEAMLSISWSLRQDSDHYWLINDQPVHEVAQRLIAISAGQSHGDAGNTSARAILDLIKGEKIWPEK